MYHFHPNTFFSRKFKVHTIKYATCNCIKKISFRLNHFSWLTYISPLLGSAWIYCYLLKSWYWNFFHIYIMHVHVVESKWAKRLYFKILNYWIKKWGSYPDTSPKFYDISVALYLGWLVWFITLTEGFTIHLIIFHCTVNLPAKPNIDIVTF